ncbi:hypothetical protein LX32DRAFT_60509 [Colletotrichum zoysiae]|uniref:Uncharacterized protein n=1 Tax=Colletotrichum zoysiae TaxID=1216348 RepID=A0AAD9HB26_9PEZI|nr:hypothetical protein LX32DRAFT_60509 [Colletotrichum zoysiae]
MRKTRNLVPSGASVRIRPTSTVNLFALMAHTIQPFGGAYLCAGDKTQWQLCDLNRAETTFSAGRCP